MKRSKYKQGVASFYIVAFATLVLVVMGVSFAMVIVSELTRTSNDDLSQSAYDSALAGVEDPKLAYSNYQRCKEGGPTRPVAPTDTNTQISCENIIYWMEGDDDERNDKNDECDVVGHILGRIGANDSGEVLLSSTITSGEDPINQAYTCVKIQTTLDDYRATLNANNQVRIIRPQFENGDGEAVSASDIKSIRFSWYVPRDDVPISEDTYTNVVDDALSRKRVAFQPVTAAQASVPPVMALQIVQTANSFSLDDFNITKITNENKHQTDRATMYFVPVASNAGTLDDNYVIDVRSNNTIRNTDVANTNNHEKNKPFAVFCDYSNSTEDGFLCSVTIELPEAVGGGRNDDTFMLVAMLPYGEPDTDFSVAFCTEASCSVTASTRMNISGTQVAVDSTGRANDLYRRIETRLEPQDTSFAFPYYAIQLLGSEDEKLLNKAMTVIAEWDMCHASYENSASVAASGSAGNSYCENWTTSGSVNETLPDER